MLRKVILFGLVCVIGIIVIYGGLVIYGNVSALSESKPYKMPDASEAQYSVSIKNTGNLLLSNEIQQLGNVVVLHGYWELTGKEFTFKSVDLILDKAIFGDILVKRRE